jgi:hypothetical protein
VPEGRAAIKEAFMRIAALLFSAVFVVACSNGETSTTCSSGEVHCVDNVLRTCNAAGTGWSETVCDVACVSGACQVCAPNQHKCEGQLALSCNPDGSGWGQQSCQNGCDTNTGTCKTQTCTPSQTKCSAGSLMTCKSDGSAWDLQSCEYGCDAATNQCKAQGCTAGTVSCNGSKLVTCKADGTGITEQVCDFGCDSTASPNACKQAACAAGDKRCNPSEAKQIQTCKPDRTGWNNGSLCPGTCLNGECQAPATCTAGEQTCRPNVAFHQDVIDECTAGGTWQQGKLTCTEGNCVDQGGTPKKYACGTCWKGERDCDSSGSPEKVLTCDDPMAGWTTAYDCWDTDWCIYGSCATPLTLAATKSENYPLLAQAFVQCWYWYMDQGVTKDEMCYILDGSNQTQSVSFDEMKSWVCDTATVADFGGTQADYDLAKDLVGCGFWNNSEITWMWDPLPAGNFLDGCMWYRPSNSVLFDDEDYLDYCTNFVQ